MRFLTIPAVVILLASPAIAQEKKPSFFRKGVITTGKILGAAAIVGAGATAGYYNAYGRSALYNNMINHGYVPIYPVYPIYPTVQSTTIVNNRQYIYIQQNQPAPKVEEAKPIPAEIEEDARQRGLEGTIRPTFHGYSVRKKLTADEKRKLDEHDEQKNAEK